ncbi:DUF4238 domain-containing protein [Amycolatopsis alba]|uniref:DUF4238 domain-containing protein n=1 Tax=Amycolatopsis alba DSM 44262 TaxID=1125972 RepID=A0A229S6B9_AMYAL|nr:DUF4238 domain-containing protein [Amycolatopsis alba]OXM54134.1 DUF4238 domain-containing protein [Amycolatopsis alba DSM 44262]
MAKVARHHHTVPRFYLERFARDGRVGTVELPGEKRFVQRIGDAATRNNFYTLDTVKAEDADLFERELSKLEAKAASVFREVLDKGTWPLCEEARRSVAEFAAVQYLRGPDQRRLMEQIIALTTKLELSLAGKASIFDHAKERLGREITEEEADLLWADVIRESGPPIELSARGHIEQLLRVVPDVFRYLICRPWVLTRFSRRRLFTSDTPLALLRRPDDQSGVAPALATAWGLALPLSREVGLLMADSLPIAEHTAFEVIVAGRFDTEGPPSTRLAALFNGVTMRNARRWLFHHPDDHALIGTSLPTARDVEIGMSSVDFVAMGESFRTQLRRDR